MSLNNVFTRLLLSSSRAEEIECMDQQLVMYKKSPTTYILPNAYKPYLPVIEEFANNPQGYVKFIKQLVTHFPKRSENRVDLEGVCLKIYKREHIRIVRDRVNRLIESYKIIHGAFPSLKERDEYVEKMQKTWTEKRKMLLKISRSTALGHKLDADVQRDILDNFWDEIDAQINNGDIPNIAEILNDNRQ